MTIHELSAAAVADVPELPESEVEWEDLLYRLELMTRALRVALEELPVESAGARKVLRELADREESAGRLLEAAADVAAENDSLAAGPLQDESHGYEADVDRFLRCRAHNFAMLQRRGVDVWQWRVEVPGGGPIGVYPFLVWLARGDIDGLSALRSIAERERAAC